MFLPMRACRADTTGLSIATVHPGSRPSETSVTCDASPSDAIAAAESSAIVRAGAVRQRGQGEELIGGARIAERREGREARRRGARSAGPTPGLELRGDGSAT